MPPRVRLPCSSFPSSRQEGAVRCACHFLRRNHSLVQGPLSPKPKRQKANAPSTHRQRWSLSQQELAMASACRLAAKTLFNERMLGARAARALANAPVVGLRALSSSYGGGAPWTRHGGGGDDGGMMGVPERPPRRVIERRPGDW